MKFNNDCIHKIASGFGIDEEKFKKLIISGANHENINVFGRYDELKKTLDINKTQKYLEQRDNKEYTLREAKIQADKEMRKIILNGGVDDIYGYND